MNGAIRAVAPSKTLEVARAMGPFKDMLADLLGHSFNYFPFPGIVHLEDLSFVPASWTKVEARGQLAKGADPKGPIGLWQDVVVVLLPVIGGSRVSAKYQSPSAQGY